MSTFRAGQKCVCIKEGNWTCPDGSGNERGDPVKGGIYTIDRIHAADVVGDVYLSLAECRRDSNYRSDRFRPIVTRKTNISIFTAILNGAPVGVDDGIEAAFRFARQFRDRTRDLAKEWGQM